MTYPCAIALRLVTGFVAAAIAACQPGGTNRSAQDVKVAANGTDGLEAREARDTAPDASRNEQLAAARVGEIRSAIDHWRTATDLATAKRYAEEARNLIVGSRGPDFGDADGDGVVAGSNAVGLLPGMDGGEALAIPAPNRCVERDVVGGGWSDPAARWHELKTKIDSWSPANNQFPKLASHPQRIVGWATLTLNTGDLAKAKEYGGHARIHGDIAGKAYLKCDNG